MGGAGDGKHNKKYGHPYAQTYISVELDLCSMRGYVCVYVSVSVCPSVCDDFKVAKHCQFPIYCNTTLHEGRYSPPPPPPL